MNEKEISQYLSFILRHSPQEIGLTLDRDGWANIKDLISKSQSIKNVLLNNEIIKDIVNNNDKKRFQISNNGKNIRAIQGHSNKQVQRQFDLRIPPHFLYHGTAERFINSIKEQGLTPKDRQYVHLTENQSIALDVGKRYGKPRLLIIDAFKMYNEGFEFFQTENNVWLVKHVPVKYINRDMLN